MPIDDVQFLYENHRKEDFIMFIDSAMRNKSLNPSPSDYTVFFNEPFKFVYGIEVIDALVPRTMYNVDTHNNVLTFIKNGTPCTITLEPQDYTLDNLYLAIKEKSMSLFNIDVNPKTPTPTSASGKYIFSSNQPFAIDMSTTTMREIIGFDEPLSDSNGGSYVYTNDEIATSLIEMNYESSITNFINNGEGSTFIAPANCFISFIRASINTTISIDGIDLTTNSNISHLYIPLTSGRQYTILKYESVDITNIIVFNGVFKIITPGVVNVTGERFVLIRSPEIEEHINGSFIYGKNSPGLALIKLGVLGYNDVRLDFNALKSREFFPIGKLNRMTLKFECLNGRLYDFKGVNHTIVMIIKYMVPHNHNKKFTSTLNPNYNPNFIEFIAQIKDVEPQEELDNDDEVDEYFESRYDDISDASGSESDISF